MNQVIFDSVFVYKACSISSTSLSTVICSFHEEQQDSVNIWCVYTDEKQKKRDKKPNGGKIFPQMWINVTGHFQCGREQIMNFKANYFFLLKIWILLY